MASDAYEAVKSKAPMPIKEKLANIESSASPYVSQAADKSSEALKELDARVDIAVQSAQNARELYLKKVEAVITFLKVQGVKGTTLLAIQQVEKSIAEARKVPGAVLKRVEEAFAKVMESESVQKVLSSDKYRMLYSIAGNTMTTVSETSLWKLAAGNVYPLVSKYADPMVERVSAACAMVKPIGS
jgi:lipopolysaccharide biosynthesis regulator YciM